MVTATLLPRSDLTRGVRRVTRGGVELMLPMRRNIFTNGKPTIQVTMQHSFQLLASRWSSEALRRNRSIGPVVGSSPGRGMYRICTVQLELYRLTLAFAGHVPRTDQ